MQLTTHQPTPRTHRHPASRRKPWLQATLLGSSLLCAYNIHAHDGELHTTDATESTPGLSMSLGAGLRYITADNPFPTPRIDGILGAGSPLDDQRHGDLDYAELGMHARFTPQTEAAMRITRHGLDNGSTDLEALWLEARAPDWGLAGRAGRQQVPIGFENMIHSHARTFGIAPMAMRADINDEWLADGLRVNVDLPAKFSLGGGLWNNQAYPGSDSDGVNLATASLTWYGNPWQVQLAYANADADGRALLTTGQGGHSHTTPSCSGAPTNDRVCFDGRVNLVVLAARWQPENIPWWFGGEYWYKHESGTLDSVYGTPDYTGESGSGWMDIGYRFNSRFSLAARLEQLQMSNNLNGANAALIAQQAGIANADQTPLGAGLVAEWYPIPELRLVGEWHYSELNDQSDNIFMLRAQVYFDQKLF